MKNCLSFVLIALALCCSQGRAQSDTPQEKVQTPAAAVDQTAIKATIERIDRLINELYEKDKIAPLSEKDALKLDRLQEARMLAELKLQHGQGTDNNKGHFEELLEQIGEEEPAEAKKESELLKELPKAQNLPTEDVLSRLGEESAPLEQATLQKNQASLSKPVASNAKAQEREKALNLSGEALIRYREVINASAQRMAVFQKEIATCQEKIRALIDDDFPNMGDIYECSRNLMDLAYESAIEEVELRRDLRSVLTEDQLKKWMAWERKSQLPVGSAEEKVEKELMSLSENEEIVYVPMRLVRTQSPSGKTFYQAQPLEKKNDDTLP